MKSKSIVTIFTDGSSRGNPGRGGWGAIIISNADKHVSEIGGREDITTNNRMELTAVIKALEYISTFNLYPLTFDLKVYTDSSYVLKGATVWSKNWVVNNWVTKTKKPVLNIDLWQKFLEVQKNKIIKWELIAGHVGIPANERCDEIATSFADNLKPELYKGKLEEYLIDPFSFKSTFSKKTVIKKKSGKKPYSYVSHIDGKIQTHSSWIECEKRVKGVKGARFKKVFTPAEEETLIKEWRELQ